MLYKAGSKEFSEGNYKAFEDNKIKIFFIIL